MSGRQNSNRRYVFVPDAQPKVNLPAFFRSVARARQSALLLDYDGTLAPFRRDRLRATPYRGVTELLKDIMDSGHTRLVIVSGRRASELVPLLNLSPPPEIWGTHGREHLLSDGTYQQQKIDPDTADALCEADQWIDGLHFHHMVEHKPGSLALHWRGLTEQDANVVRGKVLLGWLPIAERACLTIDHFDGGVELRTGDRNKADAVRTILSQMDVDAPVAYLGDDECDEDVFRALQDRGLRVLVRPHWRVTAADLWLRPPVQLLAFLNDWLEASRRSPAQSARVQLDLSRAGGARESR